MQTTLQEVLDASECLPALWAEKHELKNELGLLLDFKTHHRFIREPFNDMHPRMVILKPPQIGATTMQILKALYVAKKYNRQIIYTLPTEGDMYEMVSGSFNRLIAHNTILKEWVRESDTMNHKFVGNSVIRFRGTATSKQAMMFPSNLNIHDEVDASQQDIITLMETRLQANSDGWRWYFSHPSLVGAGVDIYWQQSDKREWVITCPCTQKQVMTWPASVSIEREAYVCKTCDAILPESSIIGGYWMPTAQGEFRGYHISQFMCTWIPAKKIINDFNDPQKNRQYFYNYVLGLPYQGGDDQITREQVLRNCVPETNSQEGRIIIGVDTGLPIYYIIMNEEGVFYYGSCPPSHKGSDPYDELRRLLKRFPRAVLVSDQGGDLIGIRKLQSEFPGRVFLAYYRKDRKSADIIKWGEGDDFGIVTIDRNRHMQLVIEQLKEGERIKLNGTQAQWSEFADHFATLYRERITVREQQEKDDRTLYGTEYVWKRRGADHWAHAMCYAMAGMQRYGHSNVKPIGQNILDDIEIGIDTNHFTGDVILATGGLFS